MGTPRLSRSRAIECETREVFKEFHISASDFLDDIEGRSPCKLCKRSRKFYCYKCYIPMPPLENKLPKVQLPLKVAIVKHPLETDGKSTAIHGPILAPDCVDIYTHPDLPNTEKSILVFPSADAEDAASFMERVKAENNGIFPYDRVIFIDSTWNSTNKIAKDEKIAGLPKVKLTGIDSRFWRYHKGNPQTHLSTIEAIYHFSRIYHRAFVSETYDGEFDNLLFFFRYMFNKIRQLYDPKTLKAYVQRGQT